MEAQWRKRLYGLEREIGQVPVAFELLRASGWILLRPAERREHEQEAGRSYEMKPSPGALSAGHEDRGLAVLGRFRSRQCTPGGGTCSTGANYRDRISAGGNPHEQHVRRTEMR